jgi:hypothetical protein
METLKEELALKLEQIAFTQAHSLIGSALKTTDEELLANNMYVVERTATHLLASIILNRVISKCDGGWNENLLQAEMSDVSDMIRACVKWNKQKVDSGEFTQG